MKTFAIILLITILFNGCAQQNAFEKFDLSATRELSEDSIQSLKITQGDKIIGIVNAIYLNKVLPNEYKDNEYFYVYYYMKEGDMNVSFTLNGEPSMLREELPAQNEFSNLTSFLAPWSKYYLLGFKKQGNVLKLSINTNVAANATLEFVKDK
ncbi:hypothetical protein [Sulfurimonas paralvinellae]|uniref:Uncharacterized protein n=1 Tax=Sulfurimonas paralvinellae TaxID=317658 RepID=A0A7M1B7H5_9BACT|nr:hypothetical protein [Sulfurimonas paralvinellae]QOP45687.1 hypothetical protein FM071_05070 [Sulfurimonas paralvinellae]